MYVCFLCARLLTSRLDLPRRVLASASQHNWLEVLHSCVCVAGAEKASGLCIARTRTGAPCECCRGRASGLLSPAPLAQTSLLTRAAVVSAKNALRSTAIEHADMASRSHRRTCREALPIVRVVLLQRVAPETLRLVVRHRVRGAFHRHVRCPKHAHIGVRSARARQRRCRQRCDGAMGGGLTSVRLVDERQGAVGILDHLRVLSTVPGGVEHDGHVAIRGGRVDHASVGFDLAVLLRVRAFREQTTQQLSCIEESIGKWQTHAPSRRAWWQARRGACRR